MSKPQTEDNIFSIVRDCGALGITEIVSGLYKYASPMTVRAYVEKMTKDGKLIRDPVTKKYSINDQYQGA